MAKNRMLPFGYRVESGTVKLNALEADTVRRVFREYAMGSSYKAIADALTADGISYTPAKPVWNKNMIARLLQNEDYLGTDTYPSIIEHNEYAAAKAAQKQLNYTEPPALRKIGKLLVCGECGQPLARRVHANGRTRWYCKNDNQHIPNAVTDEFLLETVTALLYRLKQNPNLVKPSTDRIPESALKLARLQNEINGILAREVADEAEVRKLILRLATAKYEACDNNSATALALQELLKEHQHESDLNPDVLMAITDQIVVTATVTVSLSLKSGETISEGA